MRVINNPSHTNTYKTTVAIGDFDGLHRGHMQLISQLGDSGGAVLTFNKNVRYIYSEKYKIKLLEEFGVDTLVIQEFSEDFKHTSGEDFFYKYLLERLNAEHIVVGYNFRFGHKHTGDTKLLERLCAKNNIRLSVIEPVMADGDIVSSTLIRQCITEGKLVRARELLGRDVTIYEKISSGKKLGRTIGFPTINMHLNSMQITPPDGVYLSKIQLDDGIYHGISNLGHKPTVDGTARGLETYIIDFDGDLYGRYMAVHLLSKIRDITKFPSINQLKNQLKLDLEHAKSAIAYRHG